MQPTQPNLFQKITDAFIYTNLLIALCAVCMICQTYLLLGQVMIMDELLYLVFAATMATYILARLMGLWQMKQTENKHKMWMGRHEKVLILLLILTALVCLGLFLALQRAVQIGILISGVLTILYLVPLIRVKGRWWRIRDVGLSKIFLIALMWALVTVVLPVLNAKIQLVQPFVALLFVERFLFIFAITLPFDIRDMDYDTDYQLQTIPLKIGVQKTLFLAYGCILLAVCIMLFNFAMFSTLFFKKIPAFYLLALTTAYLIATYIISRTDSDKPDQFYTGWLDFTMIVQFGLVWGSQFVVY